MANLWKWQNKTPYVSSSKLERKKYCTLPYLSLPLAILLSISPKWCRFSKRINKLTLKRESKYLRNERLGLLSIWKINPKTAVFSTMKSPASHFIDNSSSYFKALLQSFLADCHHMEDLVGWFWGSKSGELGELSTLFVHWRSYSPKEIFPDWSVSHFHLKSLLRYSYIYWTLSSGDFSVPLENTAESSVSCMVENHYSKGLHAKDHKECINSGNAQYLIV